MSEKTLREIRCELGLSQSYVAKRIGCREQYYSLIERNMRNSPELREKAQIFLENTLKNDTPTMRRTLRRMRLKAGLTQRQTAQIIRCNANHYSQIERGQYKSPLAGKAMKLFEHILKERGV